MKRKLKPSEIKAMKSPLRDTDLDKNWTMETMLEPEFWRRPNTVGDKKSPPDTQPVTKCHTKKRRKSMSMFGSKSDGKVPNGVQKTYGCIGDRRCKGRARYKYQYEGFIYYRCPRCGIMFHTGKVKVKEYKVGGLDDKV